MKKSVSAKLKSNTGASVAVALLLFLICAVIGAVVLAAGSASAGRLSRLAEFDRKYYAVSSATELLKKELDGRTVEITETAVSHDTKRIKYLYNAANEAVYDSTVITPDADPAVTRTDTSQSLLSACSDFLIGTEPVFVYQVVSTPVDTLTITPPEGGLAVKVTWDLKRNGQQNGTLRLFVRDSGASDNYTVIITLSAEIAESTQTDTSESEASTVPSAGGYDIVSEITTSVTHTRRITWKVVNIEKEVAADA